MIWTLLHKRMTPEMLGYVPNFFDEFDGRPAADQIREQYIGGWHPMPGFTMAADGTLNYPGDPPLIPLAAAQLRDERLVFYASSWLAIIQADGSYEVSRVD